jgi:hypothetical protein
MFTVKLYKQKAIKLVCGESVHIFPVGPEHPDDPDKKPSSSVMAVAVADREFYIADNSKPRPPNFGETIEFFDMAYVENASGATTEKVRPY